MRCADRGVTSIAVVLSAELIEDPSALEAIAPAWDELASRLGLPMSTSFWMLGWWRHLSPPNAQLRVVVVSDAGEVIGVAPFFAVARSRPYARVDYRLLSANDGEGISPLATPGREWDVAPLFAGTLAKAVPRPDLVAFEGIPMQSIFPVLIRESWPGIRRPPPWRPTVGGASTISLAYDSLDAWLAAREPKLRAEARRRRRRLEEANGTVRWSTAATLGKDLETMVRLHKSRWEGRARSSLAQNTGRLVDHLLDIGKTGCGDGRLRVQIIEVDGEPISAHVAVATGGTIISYNGGWDERYKALSPPMLRVLATVEDGIARNDRYLSLGYGVQSYKQRFADENHPLVWGELVPPGPRGALTRAGLARRDLDRSARRGAKRALNDQQVERLRGLRRRWSR
jgi:CelD/BcsL family acetyltransferase involved in cellulose biosynthesis